jgi:ABC-2 type transport system ATP-binding protein
VDQGTLAELRHLGAHTLEVTFADGAPELPPLPRVKVERTGSASLRFEVSGPIGPLLQALAPYEVQSLESHEPTLEEIFVHHYDDSDGGRGIA